MKNPPMTHAEKTKLIAQVCSKFRKKVIKMNERNETAKWHVKEQALFLQKECALNNLNYEGVKSIIGIKNEY